MKSSNKGKNLGKDVELDNSKKGVHTFGVIQKLVVISILFFMLWGVSYAQKGKKKFKSVVLQKRFIGGVKLYILYVNQKDKNVLVTSAFAPGYSEIDRNYPTSSLREMVRIYKPLAIINGTFFDAFSHRTVCNVVVNGKLVCEGDRGSTIYIDKDGKAGIMLTSRLLGRNIDWSSYKWAIQGGPTLLLNGKIMVKPHYEGFGDPALMKPSRRVCVGITKSGKIVFVVTPYRVSLIKMAYVMKKLGIIHAINLDGGSSAGLGYGGAYPVKPKRSLTNFVMIYEGRAKRVPTYPEIRWLILGRNKMYSRRCFKLASSFEKKGKFGASLKYYKRSLLYDPSNVKAMLCMARILKKTGRNKLSAKYYGKASLMALDGGNVEKARIWADASLKLDKNCVYAKETLNILSKHPQYMKVVHLISLGKYDKAYSMLVNLLEREGESPRFYFTMARIYHKMDRNKKRAEAFYKSALYFKKEGKRLYDCYLAAKRAVEINPFCPKYRYLLSWVSIKRGMVYVGKYHKIVAKMLESMAGNNTKGVSIETKTKRQKKNTGLKPISSF